MLASDPIGLLLNASTGDVVVPLKFVAGLAGVAQAARARLSLIAGEWFLDLDAGIPYFERVGVTVDQALFGQRFDQAKAIRAYRKVLAGTPGVRAVTSLTVTFSAVTRGMVVTWSLATAFGDTAVDTLTLGL